MKIACVTTTIRVPRILALYARYDPDVFFIVIGDRKTDDLAVVDFLTDACPNHAYYGIDRQHAMYPELSPLLGENCIQRRNIGFLEALQWGADIIVSIDDDNIPLHSGYFWDFHWWCAEPRELDGLKAFSPTSWFDPGTLLVPPAEHRGFPHTRRAQPAFEAIVGAKIGVAAGLCLGDPDIGAVTRIATGPIVHGVSQLAQAGVIVDPRDTATVFNSQNTAICRELLPTWFMFPCIGRYDDIYASLVVQRIMRDLGYTTHFGQPFVWQQRNEHDLTKDLSAELFGMERIVDFQQVLSATPTPAESVIGKLQQLYGVMEALLPSRSSAAWGAWLTACEKAMKQ